MTRAELLNFLRSYVYATQASVSTAGTPQSAIVGISVSDRFEIIFDTVNTTRKAVNLQQNPNIALVIGDVLADAQKTAQYEGVADFPRGAELDRCKSIYFEVFPDGHEREQWEGITYVRVRPRWIRFSDYSAEPPLFAEFDFPGDEETREE